MGTSGKPTILVTRKLPAVVEQRLTESYSPRLNAYDRLPGPAELLEGAIGADGLLVTVTDRLDERLIAQLPEQVRIIATFSVGVDHIDLAAAQRRGIIVTNTPDVLTDATAEIAMLLLLGAARGATAGEAAIRNDRWENWAPTGMLGVQLSGKRLGIFGMGKIGGAVAHRARAFGMEIHYHNRRQLAEPEQQGATYYSRLEELLPVCDFLSINCASTMETREALDADRIAEPVRSAEHVRRGENAGALDP